MAPYYIKTERHCYSMGYEALEVDVNLVQARLILVPRVATFFQVALLCLWSVPQKS